jgi:hypothetical protein
MSARGKRTRRWRPRRPPAVVAHAVVRPSALLAFPNPQCDQPGERATRPKGELGALVVVGGRAASQFA